MAEHGAIAVTPVLGVAMDGLGYGSDGGLWAVNFCWRITGSRRLAHFIPVAMGGIQAMREPGAIPTPICSKRSAGSRFAGGFRTCGSSRDRSEAAEESGADDRAWPEQPSCLSCGRLFDAVAATLGICTWSHFEGQAAMEMEVPCSTGFHEQSAMPIRWITADGKRDIASFQFNSLWQALLEDLAGWNRRCDCRGAFSSDHMCTDCADSHRSGPKTWIGHSCIERWGVSKSIAAGGVTGRLDAKRGARTESRVLFPPTTAGSPGARR